MRIYNKTPELFRTQASAPPRRFDRERLESHLAVSRYGAFQMTDAIRPSFELAIVPEEGFRRDFYVDPETKTRVPILIAAVSREKLIDVFFETLEKIGPVVDVVIESSHRRDGKRGQFLREGVDVPVLKSVLCDFEDVALDDGCFGLAALNPETPCEAQFDEHKLIAVYGGNLREFETIFERYGVARKEKIKFLNEAEHIHSSRQSFARRFEAIKIALGAE